MRRGSIGSDEAVEVNLVTLCFAVALDVVDDGVGPGVTTGNKLVMLPGVTVVPGSPGTDGGGGNAVSVLIGAGDAVPWPTTVVIVASAGDSVRGDESSELPWTLTVRVT